MWFLQLDTGPCHLVSYLALVTAVARGVVLTDTGPSHLVSYLALVTAVAHGVVLTNTGPHHLVSYLALVTAVACGVVLTARYRPLSPCVLPGTGHSGGPWCGSYRYRPRSPCHKAECCSLSHYVHSHKLKAETVQT